MVAKGLLEWYGKTRCWCVLAKFNRWWPNREGFVLFEWSPVSFSWPASLNHVRIVEYYNIS